MKYNPRRPWDDSNPDGYSESDQDYVNNNQLVVVQLLDIFPIILAALQADDLSAKERIECIYEAFETGGLL